MDAIVSQATRDRDAMLAMRQALKGMVSDAIAVLPVAIANEAIGDKNVRDAIVAEAIAAKQVVPIDDHRKEIEDLAEQLAEATATADEWGRDLDRLHEAIAGGRRDDALALLRDMSPGHDFLSDAAATMLAGFHQGTTP